MPKTKINYPIAQVEIVDGCTPPDSGHNIGNGATVQVGWNKEVGWVQVGFEVNVGYAKFAAERPTSPGRTQMWTSVLTGDEIDKLIKALRKAKRHTSGPSLIG